MKATSTKIIRCEISLLFSTVCLLLLTAATALGQTPPPNDNFSNSIPLTGTDIIFSGSLAGSTLEGSESMDFDNIADVIATGSIWWNWTAPTNTTLTLEMLNPPLFQLPSLNVLAVYTATNGSTTPAGLILPALAFLPGYGQVAPLSISIPVRAGTNYQIQLIGNNPAPVSISLIATNTPVILTQPRSQTVYSNASALFYVVYAGTNQASFSFQWSLNGTNISGATAAMLPLTNIDSTMAGSYTVAVSNSSGVTISQPALLTVSQSNVPVMLGAISALSNAFTFSVAGESGRSYRLQSSTNFFNWNPAIDFEEGPYSLSVLTSIFWETNDSEALTITNSQPTQFFRVTPYIISDPAAEICINNLRQIRIAKLLWARDSSNTNSYYAWPFGFPADTDLQPYFPQGILPVCPDDMKQDSNNFDNFAMSYTIGALNHEPVCNINPTNHVLEDPQ